MIYKLQFLFIYSSIVNIFAATLRMCENIVLKIKLVPEVIMLKFYTNFRISFFFLHRTMRGINLQSVFINLIIF